jgi:hypothetical protein
MREAGSTPTAGWRHRRTAPHSRASSNACCARPTELYRQADAGIGALPHSLPGDAMIDWWRYDLRLLRVLALFEELSRRDRLAYARAAPRRVG